MCMVHLCLCTYPNQYRGYFHICVKTAAPLPLQAGHSLFYYHSRVKITNEDKLVQTKEWETLWISWKCKLQLKRSREEKILEQKDGIPSKLGWIPLFLCLEWVELLVWVVGVALESSWLRYRVYFTLPYENYQDVSRKENMQSVFMGVSEERMADVKYLAKKIPDLLRYLNFTEVKKPMDLAIPGSVRVQNVSLQVAWTHSSPFWITVYWWFSECEE